MRGKKNICLSTRRAQKLAMKILFSPVDSDATGCQRMIYPLTAMRDRYNFSFEVLNSFDAKAQIKKADIVWLQCVIGSQQRSLLDYCNTHGVPVVIDYDDYFAELPSNVVGRFSLPQKEITENWKYYLRSADIITVPCEALATEIKKLTDKQVKILPNLIKKEIFLSHLDYDPYKDTSEIRIMYSCSESHLDDFNFISPVLRWLSYWYPQVKILTNGKLDFLFHNPKYTGKARHIGRVSYESYYKTLAEYRPHIFLAPVLDSVYNRCRSDLKYRQAAVLKCAFLGSNSEVYSAVKHEVSGVLSENYRISWFYNLRRLIKNLDTARQLGEAAYAAQQNHLLEDNIYLWKDVFCSAQT